MANTQLHDFARMGAQSRLAALDQERGEILKMFPELRDGAGRDSAKRQGRRRGGMSAEARKRQGERMKAYWAAKRAERQGASGEGAQADAKGATNGSASARRSGRKAGRKQGLKR